MFGAALGLSAVLFSMQKETTGCEKSADDNLSESPPVYSKEEIAKHNSLSTGIWVSYKDGVYDVTSFVTEHPGGMDKIMLAAGGAVDPYWSLYQQHNVPMVQEILKKYRIGNLKQSDQIKESDLSDPYSSDPERHPALKVLKKKPFNAEVPATLLVENMITPIELWYVRHHHPVPVVDPETFRLEIGGTGIPEISLTLEEIKTLFKKHTIVTTMQCAGNRRKQLDAVKKTQGLLWQQGAISTGEFAGVRLRDILLHAGVDEEKFAHIWFKGIDDPYDASIPVQKAFDKYGDVLIAYEMNGVEMPREHGYPLRAVVPGVCGARNVKWVNRIYASENLEAESNWQRGVPYKGFSPNVTDFKTVDPSKVASVQELPVQSAICDPQPETTVSRDDETVTLKGFAWSGGGRGIVRVDVTADGGKNWHTADLKKLDQKPGREWAWSLFEAEVPIPRDGSTMQLSCKAVDTSYNQQPEHPNTLWNLRGILNNSWHRVNVNIKDE